MTSLAAKGRWRPRPDLLRSTIEGEVTLLDVEAGRYFAMDPTASRIFQLLDECTSLDEICARLREEYEVDDETCRSDVAAFIETLLERQLVHQA